MSRAGKRFGDAGFTLFELLIVLTIIGAMVALAVPIYSRAMPGMALKAEARTVATILREARGLAIAGNREIAVAIDLDRRTIDIAGGRTETVDGDIGLSLYTAAEESIGAGIGRIRFYPDGTSTGGRVRLLGHERRIDVVIDWISGNVSVHE